MWYSTKNFPEWEERVMNWKSKALLFHDSFFLFSLFNINYYTVYIHYLISYCSCSHSYLAFKIPFFFPNFLLYIIFYF